MSNDCPSDTTEHPICPYCGSVIDYCQGHGETGDPDGFAVLEMHEEGDHSRCFVPPMND